VRAHSKDRRRESADKTSRLAEAGLKRSERLRDRRVHYADMIHGIHQTTHAEHEHQQHEQRVVGRSSSSSDVSSGWSKRVSGGVECGVVGSDHEHSRVVDALSCLGRKASSSSSWLGRHAEHKKRDVIEPQHAASVDADVDSRRQPQTAVVATQSPPSDQKRPDLLLSRHGSARPTGRRRFRRTGSNRRRRQIRVTSLDAVNSRTSEVQRSAVTSGGGGAVDNSGLGAKMPEKDNVLVNEKWTDCDQSTLKMETSSSEMAMESACDDERGQPTNTVPVMHVSLARRVGRRRHSQTGQVLLDRLVSVQSACVRCCDCAQLLSVAEFVGHSHAGAVRRSTGARRLGPRGVAGAEWQEFQRRMAAFVTAPSTWSARVCHADGVVDASVTSDDFVDACATGDSVDNMGPLTPPSQPALTPVARQSRSSDKMLSAAAAAATGDIFAVAQLSQSEHVDSGACGVVEARVTRSTSHTSPVALCTADAAASPSATVTPQPLPRPRQSQRICHKRTV